VDDCLTLWVDGRVVKWDGRYSCANFLSADDHAPVETATNPLDAAPVAIGIRGGGAEVTRALVYRDVYYVSHTLGGSLADYPGFQADLKKSANKEVVAEYLKKFHKFNEKQYSTESTMTGLERNALASNAALWGQSPLSATRRTVDFYLKPQWYFPMGDNSSASSDARSWREHHVPERLLIGRAVLVFWPHYWNAPIPFLPNFRRMGLIR
jgi:signal peptidase I